MSYTTCKNGRLGNQIIRNIAMSLLAEKFDLYVDYSNYDVINNILGINLYIGKNNFFVTKHVIDNNYLKIYNYKKYEYNLDLNETFFQKKEIINLIYKYLNSDKIKNNIIKKNIFNERYNNNNDLYIHFRLGDIYPHFNISINYYIKTILTIDYDNIYLSTDSIDNKLICKLLHIFPNIKIIKKNETYTIQFASTCKHIILSHGSFSAIIGYISFNSNIYFLDSKPKWCSLNMFLYDKWNPVKL